MTQFLKESAALDVATTDENLSVDSMFQQAALPSLGRQIFSVIDINGPTGALFNIRRKPSTNNFELLRKDVEVYPSVPVSTGLTAEVVQDLLSQYGAEAKTIIGRLLRGISNESENTRTLEFLEAKSKATTDLQLGNTKKVEDNVFKITQKVNELILLMNTQNMRTYEACVVLPYTSAASFMGLNNYISNSDNNIDGLKVSQVNNISYFMNPNPASSTAYVMLKDTFNPSKSSGIFSPYTSEITEAQDADTGNMTYFIVNRFAITESPLHVTDNEMFYKFNIVP